MRSNIEAELGRMRLTKEKIAQHLRITPKTYNNYINGASIPSETLVAMAELFRCSTDYLLGLTDQRTA